MSSFCKVIFSDKVEYNFSQNSSNIFYPEKESAFRQNCYELIWRLNDKRASKIFYELMKNWMKDKDRTTSWNIYDNSADSLQMDLQKKIQDLSAELNLVNSRVQLPRHFLTALNSESATFCDLLNEIHFFFEKNLHDAIVAQSKDDEFLLALEAVNKLIHQIEKILVKTRPAPADYFYAVRNQTTQFQKTDLADSDYKDFELNVYNGDLVLDAFVLGKELQSAFLTNDFELVRQREIKSQLYVTSSVNFCFNSFAFKTKVQASELQKKYKLYYDWCKKSDALSYGYDYSQPIFNLGRIVLGDLLETDLDLILSELKKKPYIKSMEVFEN